MITNPVAHLSATYKYYLLLLHEKNVYKFNINNISYKFFLPNEIENL